MEPFFWKSYVRRVSEFYQLSKIQKTTQLCQSKKYSMGSYLCATKWNQKVFLLKNMTSGQETSHPLKKTSP